MIPVRLSFIQRRIYVRLLAHASYWIGRDGLEENVERTMRLWMGSPGGRKGFWDVGANIGVFSFMYAAAYPESRVLSFEPDKRNLECLRRTMAAWKLGSHRLIAAAVSDRAGSAEFAVDRISGATGTLVMDHSTFNERNYNVKGMTEMVELVRLDDFEEGEPPGLIKIDVEGAEVGVLKGAAKMLEEAAPLLLFESFEHKEECGAVLAGHGYSLFDADRCCAVSDKTTNFLALVRGKAGEELLGGLRGMGYPV